MNEFDPTKREHINISPLHRLEADMIHVDNYENLLLSLMRYLSEEFNLNESYVHRIYDEQQGIMPSAQLFELNPVLAREQALLVLIKVALPLAENFIEDERAFVDWTIETGKNVLNLERSAHDLVGCSEKSLDMWAPHSCFHSVECPIKFTAYKLIQDAVKIDYESPDYLLPWVEQKISRTIAKVEIAQELELIETNFGNSLVHSYLRRVHMPPVINHFPLEN